MATFLALAATGLALLALWRVLALWNWNRQWHIRMDPRGREPTGRTREAVGWIQPYIPVFASVGRQLTWNPRQIARWLQLAGSPPGWDTEAVMALRGLSLCAGLLAGTLFRILGLSGPVGMLALGLGGYLAPDLWLWSRARRRQAQLARDVPDVMDLIATCLEADAGLSIPQVLGRAEPHLSGPLQDEVRLLHRQVEMGMLRDQAYQDLVDRNECPELTVLVEPLRRGGELGVPIAETVRAQAAVLRQMRRRKARWAGERADLWVSVITFALSLPSALVFIFALFLLVLVTRPEALGLRLW